MSPPGAPSLHWADYLIFALTLVVSTAIGIFFAWKDRKQQNTTELLLGGRQMSLLPVSLSLMATLLSAVMVLGVPSEVYFNGTTYWLILFSNFLTYPIAAHAFLPVYHNLGLTSAYEYLELRFNKAVRIIGCCVFQVQMTLSMAMGLYAPAITLNAVMDISMLISILVIGAICTFYTAIGGLKAVMWTDTFQMFVILGGFIAVLIQGSMEVGGFSEIWDIADKGNKLSLNNFDLSPLERHTFWTLIIGGSITTLTVYGGNQAMIQRYLSMENVKKAQISLYLQLPAGIIVTTLFVYGGLVLYGKYHDNDPLQACLITVPDQLIPWMVLDVLGNFHGFPGLFLSCIFSASLSTVSSGINAIALVMMTDIVQPTYQEFTGHEISQSRATILSKILAVVSGGVTIGLAFLAENFGSLILQVALSIYGMVGGPLLGLFVCAMFIPSVNSWGALAGLLSSLAISFWIAIGAILNSPAPPQFDCSTPANVTANMTMLPATPQDMTTPVPTMGEEMTGLQTLYSISYLWYSAISVIVAVIVGTFVSCLTNGTRDKPVDKRMLSPLYHAISSFSRITDATEEEQSDVIPEKMVNGKLEIVVPSPTDTKLEKPPLTQTAFEVTAYSNGGQKDVISNGDVHKDNDGYTNLAYTEDEAKPPYEELSSRL